MGFAAGKHLPPQAWASVAHFVPEVMASGSTTRKHGPGKPAAHLWTSTHTPDGDYPSEWLRWCHENEYYADESQVAVLHVGPANIYTIDSIDDLTAFFARGVTSEDMSDIVGRFGPHTYTYDWTLTCRAWEIDALRVTDKGHWATRFTEPGTYGWDCESTAWVNPPVIERVEQLAPFTRKQAKAAIEGERP